jgi:hypothetical protein
MRRRTPAPHRRTSRLTTLGAVAVSATIVAAAAIGTFVFRPASSSEPPFSKILPTYQEDSMAGDVSTIQRPDVPPRQGGDRDAAGAGEGLAIGEDDGVLPDGVSVFDNDFAGVVNLDPNLLQTLREAAIEAESDSVTFYVTSGWRSPAYQNQLLHEAVAEYGSEAEAARWVASAETSAHVSGDAVDIGGADAIAWLSEHGAGYGICQIYGNEPWHFELRPEAISIGCPPMHPDPTHDPRMQQ